MIDEAALQRGRDWEEHVAAISGGCLVPASGAKWNARGDIQALLLVQCKAERKRTWAQTRRELKDAIDDAIGTGRSAVLAVLDDDDEELVVLRLSDFIEALTSDARLPTTESRGEERRRLASTPSLLREIDET